ncbi:MAG: hypothetical protein B6I28_03895 [Fusobacteriia bacterium 4572_132]|nr:MAG: hypothetical protein B6I28_03895 [Fusobacteriia bacterium 4572_132]
MKFTADLHIHSVLSPCADLLMTMDNIFKKLKENNIRIFSITDHNSNKNSEVFQKRAKKEGLLFIPGIEIQTSEEIHILAYFPSLKDLEKVTNIVYDCLPPIKNREEIFGYQLILDEDDEFIEKDEHFLATATNLSIEDTFKLIKENNGIVVPAHLDKTSSLISNLGYIPSLNFDAFEIYIKHKIDYFKKEYSLDKPILSSSDAHIPDSIKKGKIEFEMDELSIDSFFECIVNNNFKII